VDFSTGSVGLGVVTTTFTSYCQDWLRLKGMTPQQEGAAVARTIGIVGDAELDEGNVFEALLESAKLDMRNNWWIVDFNRQSLDNVASDKSFRYIDKM
jgi:pyruvate dehydrogenase E1 component